MDNNYVEKGRFNSKRWISDNTVPLDERLNIATMQRMDGLHNIKAMKQLLSAAKVIKKDLVDDEDFDKRDVMEFIMDRIRRAAF